MGQTYPDIPSSTEVKDSLALILNRDEAERSNFSGATAPSDPAPVDGQDWFDTATKFKKQYRGGVWRIIEGHPPVETITALKALSAAEIFGDGAILWVLGESISGDCTPFQVKWVAASNATGNDWSVFRPTTGTASSGNGRWTSVAAAPGITFANSDATPSVKHANLCTTASTAPGGGITDFDDVPENHLFTVQRGSADCIIVHNASVIDLGGANITLTSSSPRLTFLHVNGVHRLVAGAPRLNPNNNLSEITDPPTARRSIAMRDDMRARHIIAQTGFPSTTVPKDFTNSGWTFSNGAVAPATGGWDKWVQHEGPSYSVVRSHRARFTVSNLSAHFGIVTRPASGLSIASGLAATVDIPNSLLKIFSHYDNTTGTLLASGAIGFTIVTGRTYLLEVETNFAGVTFTLLDEKTGQRSNPVTYTATIGYGQGKAGIIFIAGSGGSGNVTCNYFESVIGVGASPYAVLFGDSNMLGNVSDSWVAQLERKRNKGDILYSPQAGGSMATIAALHEAIDLWSFRPRYVVLCVGTNDLALVSQATWRTSVTTLKAKLDARGIKLVMMTIPPQVPSNANVETWNADIRGGSQFGYDVRYIETAYPLSSVASYDGATLNSTSNSGDGIHLNQTGHDLVFACVERDAPYLINDGHAPRVLMDLGAPMRGMEIANSTLGDAVNDIMISVGHRLASDRSQMIYNATANFVKRIDATFATGNGAGGRNTGESLADGTWHMFAIASPTGYQCDMIFTQSLTPGLPAGYTVSCYLGSILRVSGTILGFTQNGDDFDLSDLITDYNAAPANTNAFTITLSVPLGIALDAKLLIGVTNTGEIQTFLNVNGLHQTNVAADQTHCVVSSPKLGTTPPTGGVSTAHTVTHVRTNTSGQVRGRVSALAFINSVNVGPIGWRIDRRRVAYG